MSKLTKFPTVESFTSRQSWPEYGIETKNFLVNKQDTNFQAIYKNGNFVKMMTKSYEVLPNEEVLKITDDIAKKVSLDGNHAVPLTMADKEWFYVKPQDHGIMNEEQTQTCAMYVFPKEYDIGGKGIKIGFVARNSIDGKWSFSASVLSFRQICENMMMHIAKMSYIGVGQGDYLGVQNKQDIGDIREHQVQALAAVSKRHTKSLTADDLKVVKESIQSVVDSGLDTIKRYRELVKQKMNQEIANTIANRIPKSFTKEVEWLDIDKKGKITFDEKTTQWKAFNDLTEKLTHEGTNFRRNLKSMQVIDGVFNF